MDPAQPAPDLRFRLSLGFVCLVLAAVVVYEAMVGTVLTWTTAAVGVAAIVGLVLRRRWGRHTALVLLWLMMLVGVFSAMPSRLEGDQMTGKESPPVEAAALELVVICSLALAGLHLLGVYKQRFR